MQPWQDRAAGATDGARSTTPLQARTQTSRRCWLRVALCLHQAAGATLRSPSAIFRPAAWLTSKSHVPHASCVHRRPVPAPAWAPVLVRARWLDRTAVLEALAGLGPGETGCRYRSLGGLRPGVRRRAEIARAGRG